jgi:hypothetical protein
MKTNHYIEKLLLALSVIGASLFQGCDTESTLQSMEVADKINVALSITASKSGAATRTEAPASGGETPSVYKIQAFFVDNGLILAKRATTLSSSEIVFSNIPVTVDRIYIVGYPLSASTSPDVSSVNEYSIVASSLLKQMVEISAQDPEDATEVNTFG